MVEVKYEIKQLKLMSYIKIIKYNFKAKIKCEISRDISTRPHCNMIRRDEERSANRKTKRN